MVKSTLPFDARVRSPSCIEPREEPPASHCGTALIEGEGPTDDRARVQPSLYSRLAITVGLPILVWAIGELPVPFGADVLGKRIEASGITVKVTNITIGLSPIVAGFLLVEVVVLLVPRWRYLRVSGPHGRDRLERWSYTVGGILAAIQVWGMLLWARSLGMFIGWEAGLVFFVGGLSWIAILVGLARLIQQWGVANGFAVLLTAELVPKLLAGNRTGSALSTRENGPYVAYLIIGVMCVGIAFLIEHRRSNPRTGSLWLQTPLSGLVPVFITIWFLNLPATLSHYGLDLHHLLDRLVLSTGGHAIAAADIIVALTVPIAFLFHMPSHVTPLLRDSSPAETQRSIWLALPWTLLFTVSVGIVPTFLAAELALPFYASGSSLAFLVVLTLDAYHECRARVRHSNLVPVWPEHRLYAVGVLMDALEEAGIAAHARATRYRALLQFFGPYVPVEILVSSDDRERACQVIEGRLLEAEEA